MNAHDRAAQLWDGSPFEGNAGLSDGSVFGDWRTPTLRELKGITEGVEYISSNENQTFFFTGIPTPPEAPAHYWTSSRDPELLYGAAFVSLSGGMIAFTDRDRELLVLPVRGPQ